MELDILDTSSDSSSDTIILCNERKYDTPGSSTITESELDSLFKKYLNDDFGKKYISNEDPIEIISRSNSELSNSDSPKVTEFISNGDIGFDLQTSLLSIDKQMPTHDLDSLSDSDLPSFSKIKRLKATNLHSDDIAVIELPSSSEETENLKKKCTNKKKKETDRENKRRQQLEEKEKKKEEERKNKALKNALAAHYKNLKPENCSKFIKTHIDLEISKKEFSEDIISELQNNGVSFAVEPQMISSLISWTRQIDSHLLDTNGKLIDTSNGLKIEEVLLIMECIDFINHVHNQTFLTYIEDLYTILIGKKIVLIIYGLERYYRFRKNKKIQNFAKEVSSNTYKTITDQRLFENVPSVSRRTVEYALTEIQLLYSMSHRMVETKKDIALLVFQMTKSIAQLPHKLEKQAKFLQSKWFMSEDNKNCVRVDKAGNGLSRLWKQMITTFPLATLETAEAICSVYSTPLCLFKVYANVTDIAEGEKLLQDIPIRRTAGPISRMRKVGPELSKKFYYLFTSLDPDKLL